MTRVYSKDYMIDYDKLNLDLMKYYILKFQPKWDVRIMKYMRKLIYYSDLQRNFGIVINKEIIANLDTELPNIVKLIEEFLINECANIESIKTDYLLFLRFLNLWILSV